MKIAEDSGLLNAWIRTVWVAFWKAVYILSQLDEQENRS